MVSEGIKSLINRLFSDDEFRQAFLKKSDDALFDEPVREEERRAILHLRKRLAVAGGGQLEGPIEPWP